MGVMEYNTHSKVLSISLRNMQLKKIKRPEKRGTVSVMDEKFSLYFSSTFSIGGGELVFQVWTLSLPVVVIVHGNQEPNAHATITWDNAFAEPGRSPFVVPDKRPWKMIADVLMMKFESATGRTAECADYSNMLLNWSQFCKEPLPDRSFTFWDWFYAVMKLTREHLKNVWTDGHIMGFVRKRKAEEMLASQVKGTFLLRFSDSELGGITIAWKGDNTEVFMLQPFTSKDFQIRNLADRISDLPHLVYLYPDKPKDQAFSKYYTPFQDSQPMGTNGYVKPILVIHVPGWGSPNNNGMGGMNSYPSTPQNMFHPHSPPDHTRDTASVSVTPRFRVFTHTQRLQIVPSICRMTILNIMGNVLPPTISAKTIAFIPEPPISVPVLTRPGATESSMRTITTLHCSFDDISEPRCRWTPNPRSFQRDMFVEQGANYIALRCAVED
ncbi:hypothetical protein M8J76_005819 [Diaphorina citri]|nr:hypothetical protein M8J76_005819 [Diaphorina citri]